MKATVKRLLSAWAALCLLWGGALPAAAAEEERPLRVLLVGTDDAGDGQNGRSDTMLLLQAEPDAGKVRVVSFLRDLYVSIPGYGNARLNAAYALGGEELLKTVLRESFGVEADRTVSVGFDSLCRIVDALGGVELEVTEREREQLNEILAAYNLKRGLNADDGRLSRSGLVCLTGKQALSFSRIRKIDSDFQRVGRQQRVLEAMLESAKRTDFFTLARLAWICMRETRTDLTLRELNALLPLASEGKETEILTARVPFDGAFQEATVDGMQVLRPDLESNRTRLRRFLQP